MKLISRGLSIFVVLVTGISIHLHADEIESSNSNDEYKQSIWIEPSIAWPEFEPNLGIAGYRYFKFVDYGVGYVSHITNKQTDRNLSKEEIFIVLGFSKRFKNFQSYFRTGVSYIFGEGRGSYVFAISGEKIQQYKGFGIPFEFGFNRGKYLGIGLKAHGVMSYEYYSTNSHMSGYYKSTWVVHIVFPLGKF